MTTTIMHPAVAPVSTIFAFNDRYILMALDGLTPEELWRPLSTANNPILWVAGHIVHTRSQALRILGGDADTGWGALFERGARLEDPEAYPSGAEILRVMRDVTPRLQAALASLNDEQLKQPSPVPIPGMKTLADLLAFYAMHDSYHLGQLGYLRKGLGHPGLVG